MMTRVLLVGFISIGLASAASAQTATAEHPHRAGVNARQHRQAGRIKDGVQDGSLTRGERNHLRADEAAIRAEERVYRRSGYGLSPRERRDLERDLNQTSREIRRFKHNDREPGASPSPQNELKR
jgi:hypothetical protein